MQEKKILLVNYTLTAGGAERYISELANYLVNKNFTITLLLLRKDKLFYSIDKRIKIVEPDFYNSRFLLGKCFYFFRIIIYIHKNIKRIKPSLILNTAFPFFFLFSVIGFRIPVVISIRCNPLITGLIEGVKIPLFFRRLVYRRCSAIVAQTSFASEILKKQFPNNEVLIIPNILTNTIISTNVRENIIVSAGKLKKSKGFDYLIDIFKSVVSGDWKLLILGEGPERNNLNALIEDYNLRDRVILIGEQKCIANYFSRSKIFAFTSLTEGFPNVLLEAMATPLACISFDCNAGPRDLIKDGENGFLIEFKNIEEYKSKLRLLMCGEELRDKFMSESIKVRQLYDLNFIGEEYLSLIKKYAI